MELKMKKNIGACMAEMMDKNLPVLILIQLIFLGVILSSGLAMAGITDAQAVRELPKNNHPSRSLVPRLPACALRQQLHSTAMRLLPRLENEQKSCANIGRLFFSSSLSSVTNSNPGGITAAILPDYLGDSAQSIKIGKIDTPLLVGRSRYAETNPAHSLLL